MDNKAHMPNEARQPIDVAPATGTLTPEAMAPNIFMDTEYNPVTIPTRNGKSRLIKLGKSTLLNAMPHPKIAVPAYKERTEGNKRNATPRVTIDLNLEEATTEENTPSASPSAPVEASPEAAPVEEESVIAPTQRIE